MTVSVQIQYFTVGLHMLESGCDIKHFYSEVHGLKFMDVVVSLFLFPLLYSLSFLPMCSFILLLSGREFMLRKIFT